MTPRANIFQPNLDCSASPSSPPHRTPSSQRPAASPRRFDLHSTTAQGVGKGREEEGGFCPRCGQLFGARARGRHRPESLSLSMFKEHCEEVTPFIYGIVQSYQGSISAEHGVGLLKKNYLKYTRTATEINIMRGIKAVFDPDGIMNPGKIFEL